MTADFRIGTNRQAAGFSLVEVLAVLTLMALVLGAVTLRPGAGAARIGLAALARDVANEISRARMAAIRTNREEVFRVDVDSRRYGAGDRDRALPEGVAIRLLTARSETAANASSGAIRFFPDGTCTGGQVELEWKGRARLVRVDWLTGHVSLAEGGSDG